VSLHGIWMHLPPPQGGKASVSYSLNGEFRTFHAGVSLNDGPWKCIPITFTVFGDGKPLWRSRPVTSQADTQYCKDLDVRNIDRLTLEVSGVGEVQAAHAVWIEPYVMK
jgi:hypothetical protein